MPVFVCENNTILACIIANAYVNHAGCDVTSITERKTWQHPLGPAAKSHAILSDSGRFPKLFHSSRAKAPWVCLMCFHSIFIRILFYFFFFFCPAEAEYTDFRPKYSCEFFMHTLVPAQFFSPSSLMMRNIKIRVKSTKTSGTRV